MSNGIKLGNDITVDYSNASLDVLAESINSVILQCDEVRASDEVVKHALSCLIKPVTPATEGASISGCTISMTDQQE